jgi:hypothetical protein
MRSVITMRGLDDRDTWNGDHNAVEWVTTMAWNA